MAPPFHYVYVLWSRKDRQWYIGYTEDLRKRLKRHQDGLVPATKPRLPVELLFYEAFRNKYDALRRERYLKSTKGKRTLRQMLKEHISGKTLLALSKYQAKGKRGTMPNSALSKPVNLSSELEAVVGSGPMPRSEVTKKLWAYIKENNLQDPTNKRVIKADEKLQVIFGKESADMFEMTKLVSAHLS